MEAYISGNITVQNIMIPSVSSELKFKDFLGAVMVRWGINRDNYRVQPGIFAIGNPTSDSDVFVTANYKLSFDNVRKNLSGINAWILVLDTKGINVWCAAGKGTFGTEELVNQIREISLEKIVSHKRIILPQLGATGVAAHIVKEQTGFNVHYGPVRASDIKKFISEGYRSSKEMRRVKFNLADRIKLIPNDFMYGKYYLLGAMLLFFLFSGISGKGISFTDYSEMRAPVFNILFAYLAGILLTPLMLPFIPGRRFSLKGFYSGALVYLILLLLNFTGDTVLIKISWFFIITAISSFMAMNFTGSSTYTSLSGVKKEMKISLPLQIGFAITGIVLHIIGKLI